MSRREQAYIGEQLTIAALGLAFASVMIFNPFGWRDAATDRLADWYVGRMQEPSVESTVAPIATPTSVAPSPAS